MSLQGPVVVIADQKNAEIAAALTAGGAFPVVEASWRDGAAAIAKIEPSALVVTDPARPSERAIKAVLDAIDAVPAPPICRSSPGHDRCGCQARARRTRCSIAADAFRRPRGSRSVSPRRCAVRTAARDRAAPRRRAQAPMR